MASNVFQASVMALFYILLFTIWNVGASDFVHPYEFPEHSGPAIQLVSSKVHVVSLSDPSLRVRRQTGQVGSPDAVSASGADSTPDSNSQGRLQNGMDNSSTSSMNNSNSNNSGNANNNSNNSGNANNNSSSSPAVENSTPTAGPGEPDDSGSTVDEDTTPSGPNPFDEADIHHVNHKYYTSDVKRSDFDVYWSELEDAKQHMTLSNGHRLAAVIKLKFPFYFYGHKVVNVTVATGGFIYMSHFLHQWLTATQYIAPLMANFDPSLSSESNIFYQNTPEKFTVEWKDVILQDQASAGKFHFQAVLNQDNTIQFLYKKLPIPLKDISDRKHPVKVGLSDAWYNDTYIRNEDLVRRTIIEYHRVSVNFTYISNGSVVVINPLPTCNRLLDCDSCTRHVNMSFNCKWCNKIGRCSDGPDWYRQHWNKQGCGDTSFSSHEVCGSPPASSSTATPTSPIVSRPTPSPTVTTPLPLPTTAKPTTTTARKTSPKPTTAEPQTRKTTTVKPTTPKPVTTRPPTQKPTTTTFQPSTTPIKPQTPNPKPETPKPVTGKPVTSTSPTPKPTSSNPVSQKSTSTTAVPVPIKVYHNGCSNGKCDDKKSDGVPVAGLVIAILLVVALLGALGAWVFYAYTHPTSKSGMWLMEHRPSQIKAKIKFWKSNTASGTKYQVESDA